jgi:hypothetical protein
MKKLLFLFLLPSLFRAQSPKDNLLGHYTGIGRFNFDTSTDCYATCNVRATANYPIITIEDTTCSIPQAYYFSIYEVRDDSTIWDTVYQTIAGQLFPNDSIHIGWDGSIGGEVHWVEFFGFKQYGFTPPVSLNEYSDISSDLTISIQPNANLLFLQSEQGSFNRENPPLLYDVKGVELKTPVQYIDKENCTLDLSSLREGFYIVEVRTIKGCIRKKVIITK